MQCKRCQATVAGYDEPPEWCPNCDPNNLIAAATSEPIEEESALEVVGEPSVTLTPPDLDTLTVRALELGASQVSAKSTPDSKNAWLAGYAQAMTNIIEGLRDMMHNE